MNVKRIRVEIIPERIAAPNDAVIYQAHWHVETDRGHRADWRTIVRPDDFTSRFDLMWRYAREHIEAELRELDEAT